MNNFDCTLFNCKSLKKLSNYLLISSNNIKSLSYDFSNNPSKFFHKFFKDGRELFKCSLIVNKIHKRYFKIFNVDIPDYLRSSVRGRSNITNAYYHQDASFVLLVDIRGFYPSTTKSKIKKRLILDYKLSSNVAEFIVNSVTAPQEKSENTRALITGSLFSQRFAFLINKKMFDEIDDISRKNGIKFSLYVDDMTFSSKKIISYKFYTKIYNILKKYGYKIHQGKIYRGKIGKKSNITGVKLTKDGFRILNKHKDKILSILEGRGDSRNIKRLCGLIQYALQVNREYYLEKYSKIYNKNCKSNK